LLLKKEKAFLATDQHGWNTDKKGMDQCEHVRIVSMARAAN
jgi:hypothetical protein